MRAAGPNLRALAGSHIVFVNWRDLDHPQAGGAELFCQSVAERFSTAGARVTLVTARPDGSAAAETVRGVQVQRSGGTFGVYPSALRWLAAHRADIDAVIDCQNGIPFFSPLALRPSTPVVQVLHHVHQRQFPLYFPGPAARVGQILEADGSRLVYGRRPVAVVSPSTRQEARDVLGLRGPRFLVPNGVRLPADAELLPVTAAPTIACVGRLVPHKRLHLLLDATATLRETVPDLVVHMIGDGPDQDRLRAYARDLRLPDGAVVWHGYAGDAERDRLLATAWLTVSASHGEGWGLSVLEANAWGTPAVAFRVPGLRDAVRDGTTGWLVDDGEPLALTLSHALRTLSDPAAAAGWRERARSWAAGFSWDTTAELLAAVVGGEANRLSRRGPDRRRGDEPVTIADFTADTLEPAAGSLTELRRTGLQRTGLRRTDMVGAADGFTRCILYGASGPQARAALRRSGVRGPVVTRDATGEDLLVASGSGEVRVAAGARRRA